MQSRSISRYGLRRPLKANRLHHLSYAVRTRYALFHCVRTVPTNIGWRRCGRFVPPVNGRSLCFDAESLSEQYDTEDEDEDEDEDENKCDDVEPGTGCATSFPLDSDITLVNTPASAQRALDEWRRLKKIGGSRYWACDTQVIGLEENKSNPCNQECTVIAVSIFGGDDADFGSGSHLFIDNLDEANGMLELFAPFFEDCDTHKVWYNFSHSRHALNAHGIHCRGHQSDILHMARLWKSSRDNGFSLEALSIDLLGRMYRTITMEKRFSQPEVLENGRKSNRMVAPSRDSLQRDASSRALWIEFCLSTNESISDIYFELCKLLQNISWSTLNNTSMFDCYEKIWQPFGVVLTDMEAEGVFVREKYLKTLEARAESDKKTQRQIFINWAEGHCPGAKYMNLNNQQHKTHFFFAPYINKEMRQVLPSELMFSIKQPNKETGKLEKRRVLMSSGLMLPPFKFSKTGVPSSDYASLRHYCGMDPTEGQYGAAYSIYGGGTTGKEACIAIDALVRTDFIDKMLRCFITPLLDLKDKNSRLHSSLLLNTETGRLCSQKPNLIGQPTRHKDFYCIRRAVAAERGNKLIVAEYKQLELRILANICRCKKMMDVFNAGGDLHSHTAAALFPHVQSAIDAGDVLVEPHVKCDTPSSKLIQKAFSLEYKVAKTINMSITYGLNSLGLSKKMGVSQDEALRCLNFWFNYYREVGYYHMWLSHHATLTGTVRTIFGRYLQMKGATSKQIKGLEETVRKPINMPVQGGTADAIALSLLSLHSDKGLRELGWKLILQAHNHTILEGPSQYADAAVNVVKASMLSTPLNTLLFVPLVANAQVCDTWYDAE